MAALGLRCCVWAFSSCGKRGPRFIVVRGPPGFGADRDAGSGAFPRFSLLPPLPTPPWRRLGRSRPPDGNRLFP